jgi:hypothetical protein
MLVEKEGIQLLVYKVTDFFVLHHPISPKCTSGA